MIFSFGTGRAGRSETSPAFIVPVEAALALRDAADLAALALQIFEHLLRRKSHLLAEPFGDDGDIDEIEQRVEIAAQAAAIKRGQDAARAAGFRIVQRGVALMPIEMQHAAAVEIEIRKGMEEFVVAGRG